MLGISQGWAIAITYAARHPERVNRLILYGTGVLGRRRKARTEADHRELDALAELMRVSWGGEEPGFQRVYNSRFLHDGPLEQWRAFDELQKRTAPPEKRRAPLAVVPAQRCDGRGAHAAAPPR